MGKNRGIVERENLGREQRFVGENKELWIGTKNNRRREVLRRDKELC